MAAEDVIIRPAREEDVDIMNALFVEEYKVLRRNYIAWFHPVLKKPTQRRGEMIDLIVDVVCCRSRW